MAVVWKKVQESFYKCNAQEAYDEITSYGEVTPENVLEVAKNKNSVIHNCFEWNDEIAGRKYRLLQAGEMIRSFVFEREDKEQPEVRVLQISTERKVYKPVKFFVENKAEHESLLARAVKELKAIRQRYESIAELEEVFRAIDAL